MFRRVVTVSAGLVLLVGCAALSACTSSGSPKPQPSSSVISPSTIASSSHSIPVSSPAPSRTGPLTTGPGVKPGEKPPVESQFAKQHSESGALAFADYYIRVVDWSIATNDGYLLASVSGPTCTSCKRYITDLADLHAQGKVQIGGRVYGESFKIVTGASQLKADFIVEIKLHQTGVAVYQAGAVPPKHLPASTTFQSLVFLSWLDSGWLVVEQEAST